MKRILNLMLYATLTLTLICPAQATSQAELNKAAAYVREHGIMSGDQTAISICLPD